MNSQGCLTLTTDFGTRDWFVGTMKGVILGINPKVNVIDLTHEIPPGDIRAGAFALTAGSRFFPKNCVHVAVVDPGVGSARKALAIQTANFFFVGPDNGVLSWALAREEVKTIISLENEKFFLPSASRTFHGRDIFAPVAAHLSRGVPLRKFGPALKDFVRLDWPEPRRSRDGVHGEILYLDKFGNAITNLDTGTLESLGKRSLRVVMHGKTSCPVRPFYAAVPTGAPVAVQGSSGFLEIAVNGGNAAQLFHLRVGQPVLLRANYSKRLG
jgi:S-adenosylmethionine hydrolase